MTDEDRRRLDELAEGLARDYPDLARQLTQGRLLWPYRRLVSIALLIAAPPLIVLGFLTLQTLVVTIGCLALIAAAIIAAHGRRRLRWSRQH